MDREQGGFVKNPYYVPRDDKPSMAAGAKLAKEKEIDFVYYNNQRDAVAALVKGDVCLSNRLPRSTCPI